jgi:hypothetical protein
LDRRPRIAGVIAACSVAVVGAASVDSGHATTAVLAAETQPAASAASASNGAADSDSIGVDEILNRYNRGIRRALAGIESLRVAQTMFEPQEDGTTKRACAVLSYARGSGMVRDETFSELTYPAGEYTLSSVVGPELDPSEYSVAYSGAEEQEGVPCHRIEVTATTRDHSHFDGSIWISAESFAPVRIVGAVADPPFPAKEIRLDKVFAPGPHGLWLVRRHVGEGEFRFLFLSKRGERRIYYDDYEVEFEEPLPGSIVEQANRRTPGEAGDG